MSLTLVVRLIETLAATVTQIAPLIAQGKDVLGESDAAQVRAALAKAEAATAALRKQVDAALDAASAT